MRVLLALLLAVLVAPMGADRAEAQYRIQPGDQVRIEVLEDASLNRDALVLPDGRISVPLAGSINAAGLTLSQLEAAIARQLAPGFAVEPNVFVALTRLQDPDFSGIQRITVHVIGEAGATGPISVPAGTNMLQAFAAMGGFTRFAATKRVQLRRTDQQGVERVFTVNYRDVERGAVIGGNIILQEGDVILVPTRRLFE
jgi:polysaccharide export outer membrane protein